MESSNASDDEKALHEAEIKSNGDPNVSSLESGSSEASSLETDVSPLTELSELPALAAPAAYGAIRPYSALTNKSRRKPESGNQSVTQIQGQRNEEGRSKNEVQREDFRSSEFKVQSSNPSSGEKTLPESEIKSAAESHVSSLDVESSSLTELSGSREQKTRSKKPDEAMQKQGTGSGTVSCEETNEPEENSSFFPHNSLLKDNSSLSASGGLTRPPEYARILYRALCRSSGNKDGTLEFTLEEINRLLADPLFCKYEPQLAADFRKALQSAEQ